jgi:hypothetical protein
MIPMNSNTKQECPVVRVLRACRLTDVSRWIIVILCFLLIFGLLYVGNHWPSIDPNEDRLLWHLDLAHEQDVAAWVKQVKAIGDKDKPEILREAFKQACEFRRNYINMRFELSTLFTALSGALLFLAFGKEWRLASNHFGWIRVLGVVIAAIGIFGEVRISSLLLAYQQEVKYWGEQLGLKNFGTHAGGTVLRFLDTIALCLIYVGAIGFWYWAEAAPSIAPNKANASPSLPLTAAEHAEAQRRAYLYALQRGGGKLPSHDQVLTNQDFQKASREVVGERQGSGL